MKYAVQRSPIDFAMHRHGSAPAIDVFHENMASLLTSLLKTGPEKDLDDICA